MQKQGLNWQRNGQEIYKFIGYALKVNYKLELIWSSPQHIAVERIKLEWDAFL